LGGKNVFFQGSTNGTVLKGVGLLIVFQRFGSDKLDINWFHFRNWISFVADTKMRKTTSGAKIFRPTIVFTRRKSKIHDERQSPVGWISLVSTINITVFCGARVR
jgi:hypothetical protein